MMETERRWWLWKVPEGAKCIGRRGLPRKDAKEKASGKAVYCSDMSLPGMVYAKHLNSPFAHARIKKMDTSKVEKLPGVVAVIRWDDPEFKDKWPRFGSITPCPNFLPIISDTAYFYGQPVGAIVVAESEETCDKALRLLLKDMEWEEMPFNLNWDEYDEHPPAWPGYERYSPIVKGKREFGDFHYEFGDVEKGFKEADKIIEFTIRKSEEDVWAGVEASVAIARWQDNRLELWTNHGSAHVLVKQVALPAVGIKECDVEVFAPYTGGLFGGITWLQAGVIEATCALLAKKIGRPVKYIDDYSIFRGAEHHIGTYKFKVGFKNDGTITAVNVNTIYACRGFGMMLDPISKLLESTKIPNISLHSVYPLVNRNPTICYRHGAPACTVVTMIINRVAAELGMDPTEVALKNDGWHGHSMEWVYENIAKKQGFDTSRWSLKECIETGKRAIGWEAKWHPPGAKKLPNGKYHGIGFTAMEQWASAPFSMVGPEGKSFVSACIRVNADGTVSIYGMRSDSGLAVGTTYANVAADEMGIRPENVVLVHMFDKGHYLTQMSGSFGTISNLIPIVRAARKARKMLLEYATLLPNFKGKKPEELCIEDSMIFEKANPANRVPVAEVSRRHTIVAWDETSQDSQTLPREERAVMVRQAYFVEVEVDPETGEVDITNVVCVNDVGRAVNPDAINGQQYGGAYMGLGRAFTEAVHYDPLTGVKLNDNLTMYGVMLMNDVGKVDCHIVETGLSYGPYGAAGCSEAPCAVLATIAAPAIYNAIGKWIDDWPITPEKILKTL
ncbi:MAG: xanthine dehydrogenase family protein molybdopterin-binding subunit, partial [Nitrososphaerota archaeon]|nr:xanthine dehydrogenase family protein molybdopterin-binding subunit [Nitrososphaerota archaeon]